MGHGRKDRIIAIAMLMPSIALIAIFVYGFIGWTGWKSLTNSTAIQELSGQPADFIGLDNYTQLFSGNLDSRFRIDMTNTFFLTIMFVALCLSVGLLLAILLDQKIQGEGLFRTIFLFPMALSFVVTGVVWKWLFNPGSGINQLPTAIGLPAAKYRWFISQERWLEFNWQDLPEIFAIVVIAVTLSVALWLLLKRHTQAGAIGVAVALFITMWTLTGGAANINALSRPETHGFNVALIAVAIAAGWQMVGYTMAMYLAGLRGIPDELREAARVDGASEISVYRYVVLPMLAPITLSAIIILGHISLKLFDLVYVMGGGDNRFIDMPGINMYFTTFRGQEFGKGAAIAIIMLISVAVVIVPYLVWSLRQEVEL